MPPDRKMLVKMDDLTYGALKEIARREKVTIGEICALVERKRKADVYLSRALRTFILNYFWEAATEEGHRKVGHGTFKG